MLYRTLLAQRQEERSTWIQSRRRKFQAQHRQKKRSWSQSQGEEARRWGCRRKGKLGSPRRWFPVMQVHNRSIWVITSKWQLIDGLSSKHLPPTAYCISHSLRAAIRRSPFRCMISSMHGCKFLNYHLALIHLKRCHVLQLTRNINIKSVSTYFHSKI